MNFERYSSKVLYLSHQRASAMSVFLPGAISLWRMTRSFGILNTFMRCSQSLRTANLCSCVKPTLGSGPITSIPIEKRFISVLHSQAETPACHKTWVGSPSLYTSQFVSIRKWAETCLHVSQRRVRIFPLTVSNQVAVWWRTIYSQVFLSHFVKFLCRDV